MSYPNLNDKPLLFQENISAGFPSVASNYIESNLDLNELIVKHPASTFFVKVSGDSMKDAGILSGDILSVDRSLEAISGKIIVAVINGEFTVKRFVKKEKDLFLVPANNAYSTIRISPDSDFQVWGIVTYVVRKVS
jgi:DNA polymerase V